MEKKKIAEVIVALLIAAVFISSYLSLSNFLPSQSSGATTTVPQTAFGQAVTNGIITNYGTPITINVTCKNASGDNASENNLISVLNKMVNNNTIFNFYNVGPNFQVATGNVSSYALYATIEKNQTQAACLAFAGPAHIEVPVVENFTVGTQVASLYLNGTSRNGTILLNMSTGVNVKVRVKLSALITSNGTIYGPVGFTIIH